MADISPEIIFPLPYTSNIDYAGNVFLSAFSMASAGAAIIAASKFPRAKVVLAGEHTFGASMPSTGELMKEELAIAGVDPERMVVLDNKGCGLNNTSFQVEALCNWLAGFKFQPSLLTLAYGFHRKRTGRYLLHNGVSSEFFEIEDILRAAGVLDRFPELEYLDSFNRRERLMRAVSLIDRDGAFLRFVTKIRGPHLHDLYLDDDATPVFIDMPAKSRLVEIGIADTVLD